MVGDAAPWVEESQNIKITEQLFKDAGVGFKRVNRKGQGYSIAEEAVYQFLNWDAMPWEG